MDPYDLEDMESLPCIRVELTKGVATRIFVPKGLEVELVDFDLGSENCVWVYEEAADGETHQEPVTLTLEGGAITQTNLPTSVNLVITEIDAHGAMISYRWIHEDVPFNSIDAAVFVEIADDLVRSDISAG